MFRYWYTDGDYEEIVFDVRPLNVRYVEVDFIELDYTGSLLLAIF
jgi:hypothetical protein